MFVLVAGAVDKLARWQNAAASGSACRKRAANICMQHMAHCVVRKHTWRNESDKHNNAMLHNAMWLVCF